LPRERERERPTDRQTDRQTERQREGGRDLFIALSTAVDRRRVVNADDKSFVSVRSAFMSELITDGPTDGRTDAGPTDHPHRLKNASLPFDEEMSTN